MRYKVPLLQGLVWGLIAGLWECSTRLGLVDADLLPPLSYTVAEAGRLLGSPAFMGQFGATASRVAIAFVLAAPVAVVAGFVIGERERLTRSLGPAILLALSIPQSVFLPLLILFFGTDALGKIVFGITHLSLVVVVNTIAATRSVSRDYVRALRSFGATPSQIYRHLYLPAMMPLVVTGLRVGLIFDILGVLIAEMYASRSGLGQLIFYYGESGNVVPLTAAILVISLATALVNACMRAAEHRAGRFRLATT